jgi:DNA-directed RNA polymerase specialized sigma subunit
MTQVRNRKTSSEDRSTIIALLATGELSQKQIGELFKISQARVSQIKAEASSLGVV